MKIAFFSVIKKSFLTLAIFILLLSNISSLTYADDTLFSIEGMNMNSSISGGSGGLTAEQLQQILQGLNGGNWNGNNTGEQRDNNSNSNNVQVNKDIYQTKLDKQIEFLQNSEYSDVEAVDLDNNGTKEIVGIDSDNLLYVYEFNGTSFRKTDFYGIENLNADNAYFLRLEDENGESVYYLIDYHKGTINKEKALTFGDGGTATKTVFASSLSDVSKGRIITGGKITSYYQPRCETGCYDPCIQVYSDVSGKCNYVTVDTNGLHLKEFTMSQKASDMKINRHGYRHDSLGGGRNGSGNERFGIVRGEGYGLTNMFSGRGWCESFYYDDPSGISLTLDSRFQGSRGSNYFKLYYKGGNYGKNKSDVFGGSHRCNNTNRDFSLIEFIYGGNNEGDYGYSEGKLFFKNNENKTKFYSFYGNTNKLSGKNVYRYVEIEDNSNAGSSFNTGGSSSESQPYVEGNTIVDTEYDTFVKKQNSDGTYNYKITLEKPDGSQIVAFYGLNYNGIIFKDINGDGVKDIMTYENYVSEDNIKFKRIYLFIFNPETYTYDKVLDGIDALEYEWIDINKDGKLDIIVRRYDEKLHLYKNNDVSTSFENIGSIRGKHFIIENLYFGNIEIITKNKQNNGIVGEWKIYSMNENGYYNATQSYSNGLIGQNYKKFNIDGKTSSVVGIQKDVDKWKVFYYNKITNLIEDFPQEFYVKDISSKYITNGENGSISFLTVNGTNISYSLNTETGKYYKNMIYRLSNGYSLRCVEEAINGNEYMYNGENYYIAENKTDLINKINEGYDIGHIITTRVTDMSGLFQNNIEFNDSGIKFWDVGNVTTIANMFNGATSFNQDISHLTFFDGITTHTQTGWNTGADALEKENRPQFRSIILDDNGVTKTCPLDLPDGTYKINGTNHYVVSTKEQIQTLVLTTISDSSKSPYICTSKVTDMSKLFYSETSDSIIQQDKTHRSGRTWRQPICSNRNIPNKNCPSNQRTCRESEHTGTITYDLSFNGNISSWDVSNVTNMDSMFRNNHCFNQDITNWNTQNVTNMNYLFTTTSTFSSAFNKNISGWNVDKVIYHDNIKCKSGCKLPTWKQ